MTNFFTKASRANKEAHQSPKPSIDVSDSALQKQNYLHKSLVQNGLSLLTYGGIGELAIWSGLDFEDIDFTVLARVAAEEIAAQYPGHLEAMGYDSAEVFKRDILSSIHAEGVGFYRCNFHDLAMTNASFAGAHFEDCNLQGTFQGAYNLKGATLIRPALTLDSRMWFLNLGAAAAFKDERFYDRNGTLLPNVHFNEMRQVVRNATLKNDWKDLISGGHEKRAYAEFVDLTSMLTGLFQAPSFRKVRDYLLK